MTRSAWGFGIVSRDDWRLRAACRKVDPETFFDNRTARLALHICRTHCEVLADCRLETQRHTPVECVQAGKRWRSAWSKDGPGASPRSLQNSRGCPLCTSSDVGYKEPLFDGNGHAEASSLNRGG
jgi:hypothetical protein